jgi:hypothetical protein
LRKLIIMLLTLIAAVSAYFSVFADENNTQAKITAYYFHGTFRCSTCTAMEQYSREAVEASFKNALASGTLEFKSVNVEDRGNEHFVDDYKLYTKSLILSLVKDGKEVKSKNLDKIWQLARNKQKFVDYVAGEVSGFMKDIR